MKIPPSRLTLVVWSFAIAALAATAVQAQTFTGNTFGSIGYGPIATGDVDGNGISDFAAISWTTDSMRIYAGRYLQPPTLLNPAAVNAGILVDVLLADFDGDGAADLLWSTDGDGVGVDYGLQGSLHLARGNGDGTFGTPITLMDDASPTAFAVADLDRDGHLDIVTLPFYKEASEQVAHRVVVMYGNGDLTFHASAPLEMPLPAGDQSSKVYKIKAGDFDHDGYVDIVAYCNVGYNDGYLTAPENLDGRVVLLKNQGGTLSVAQTITGFPLWGDSDEQGNQSDRPDLAVLDLNGDGFLDLAVSVPRDQTVPGAGVVKVLFGSAAGLGSPQPLVGLDTPGALATGDIDGDGVSDLIITAGGQTGGHGVKYVRGGSGLSVVDLFDPSQEAGIFANAFVGVADVNFDGHRDVIVADDSLTAYVQRGTPILSGQTGPQGPQGAQGAPGPTGAAGATGPAGPAGPAGSAGQDGISVLMVPWSSAPCTAGGIKITPMFSAGGAAGPSQYVCNGLSGATGAQGPTGATGAAGPQGVVGPQGPSGPQGPAGPAGPAGSPLPSGSLLLLLEGQPAPAGYVRVGSYLEERVDLDDKRGGKKINVTIVMWRKL